MQVRNSTANRFLPDPAFLADRNMISNKRSDMSHPNQCSGRNISRRKIHKRAESHLGLCLEFPSLQKSFFAEHSLVRRFAAVLSEVDFLRTGDAGSSQVTLRSCTGVDLREKETKATTQLCIL